MEMIGFEVYQKAAESEGKGMPDPGQLHCPGSGCIDKRKGTPGISIAGQGQPAAGGVPFIYLS